MSNNLVLKYCYNADIKVPASYLLHTLQITANQIALEIVKWQYFEKNKTLESTNVVRVFVPGLRHFWKRLAPERLYVVPVEVGAARNAVKTGGS